MLHVDDVKVRESRVTTFEVVIPLPADKPVDMKGWAWLHSQATLKLEDLGCNFAYDDAFHVTVGDEELIFTFTKKKAVKS